MDILGSLFNARQGNGLDELDIDKTLKNIPSKTLTIMTFKRLDAHMKSCALTSKIIVTIVVGLAMEKGAELLHIPHFVLPSLIGGG